MSDRHPKGDECQCVVCGEFFSGESPFTEHWRNNGNGKTAPHTHPKDQKYRKSCKPLFARRLRARGTVWVRNREEPAPWTQH